MNSFIASRTLDTYPKGAHRWAMLGLTVLATILASYEFQLAPLLPLLLPYLHLSGLGYASFISFAVLLSGVAAFVGGPLADRYGRVALIDICLGTVTLLTFSNLLIRGIVSFVLIRSAMAIVGGAMAGGLAALVRDMSPRLSRALAFGLFTIGPVGANFIANAIAGATLPIYNTWQSQIWIMGALGLLMYVPILIWLKDLSPALRLQIFRSEIASLEAEGRLPTAAQLPASAREAFAALLAHREIWLLVLGVTANLTLYLSIQAFGPLMFTQAYGYSPAVAARMNANFFFANLAVLIITGIVSDRLQLRKPIAIIGGVLSATLMALWVPTFGHHMPPRTVAMIATLMGCFLAIGYVPWAAQFSETLEDVSPALQATGWAFFGLVARGWVAVSAPLTLFIAARHGWGAWVEVSCAGMVLYVIAMALSRGRLATHGAADVARAQVAAHHG